MSWIENGAIVVLAGLKTNVRMMCEYISGLACYIKLATWFISQVMILPNSSLVMCCGSSMVVDNYEM